LISSIADKSLKKEDAKYQIQGNILKVASSNYNIDIKRMEFTKDGLTMDLVEDATLNTPVRKVTLKRISESIEIPKETEPLATSENHFYRLRKLVHLQYAQANYWQNKRRFAAQIKNLKLESFPASDQLYQD
jgi:hypothetical protein